MQEEHEGVRRRPPDAQRPAGSLRRLLPFVRPYRKAMALAFTVSVLATGVQNLIPQVIRRFIDEVVPPLGNHPGRLMSYAWLALGLGATQAALAFTRRNAAGTVSLGIEKSLRNSLYAHLQRLSISFHDGWQSGQLVQRAISDIATIRRFLGFGLMWLLAIGFTFAFAAAMLFTMDPLLAAAVVAFAAPVAAASFRFAKTWHRLAKQVQGEQGDLTTIVEESAVGVRIVKAFGRGAERSALYATQAQRVFDTNIERVRTRSRYWTIGTLSLNLSLVVILLAGGSRVVSGAITLGELSAFVFYTLMLAWPVREIGWIVAMAEEAVAASERVLEILDTDPEIDDRPGARRLDNVVGHVRFEGVGLRYSDRQQWVLRDLDLDVRPGETLALVGMTGSGKSTVASMVSRFYDPTDGRITLDGHDIRDITVASLRSHVGVAFEDPILFSLSVRENLLMGSPGASDEDLWDALRAAQADAFVRNLPWGLDTRVGEQGYSLSGGQRQRLALARAVVGRPRVLVLDNPMSSVDVHTEAAIEQALRRVLEGRTALLIAHRPSTLLLADRVALIHDGRIVATGTHQELLETVPLYREVLAKDVEDEMDGAERRGGGPMDPVPA